MTTAAVNACRERLLLAGRGWHLLWLLLERSHWQGACWRLQVAPGPVRRLLGLRLAQRLQLFWRCGMWWHC